MPYTHVIKERFLQCKAEADMTAKSLPEVVSPPAANVPMATPVPSEVQGLAVP